MVVTLDTNVLYQALRSSKGASYYILQRIRNGDIHMALSVPVYLEYWDVLTRKTSLEAFGLLRTDIVRFLRYVAFVGKPHQIFFLSRPNLRDEGDNMFVELAIASQSEYLVTSNVKDFRNSDLNLGNMRIVTPAEFVRFWRKKNG